MCIRDSCKLVRVPSAVEQEAAALLQILDHVVLVDIGRVMAGNKISLADVVGGFNGLVAEAQVRNGDAAGFFGVICKVALRVHIGMVADNLDGVLVRADRTRCV